MEASTSRDQCIERDPYCSSWASLSLSGLFSFPHFMDGFGDPDHLTRILKDGEHRRWTCLHRRWGRLSFGLSGSSRL